MTVLYIIFAVVAFSVLLTAFELVCLSKLVATSVVALKFIENGKLSLVDNISKFIDYAGNFGDCKIRHLITHTSGMPSWIPLFTMSHNTDAPHTLLDADRCYKTGEKVVYSCMGYIVLGRSPDQRRSLRSGKQNRLFLALQKLLLNDDYGI